MEAVFRKARGAFRTETGPFDFLGLLWPLAEARGFIQRIGGDVEEFDALVDAAEASTRGVYLRESEIPRAWFLPCEFGFEYALMYKEDNNGTCHWFANTAFPILIVERCMNYQPA